MYSFMAFECLATGGPRGRGPGAGAQIGHRWGPRGPRGRGPDVGPPHMVGRKDSWLSDSPSKKIMRKFVIQGLVFLQSCVRFPTYFYQETRGVSYLLLGWV